MYTSVLLVALLGPGATPTVSQVPVSQVVYRTASGQVIYVIPSPTIRYVSAGATSPTTTYVVSSNFGGTTYASPVVVNSTPVVYSNAVYSTPTVYQAAPAMSYAPVMMSAGMACRS